MPTLELSYPVLLTDLRIDSASGGSYSWTPESTLPTGGTYALEISQGSDVNYSEEISITGSSAAATSQTFSASSSNTTPTLTTMASQTPTTQQTDASSSTAGSSGSTTSTHSTSNSSSYATTSPTLNPTTSSSTSSGLSTGDKAAIGVGVPFGVLLLGIVTFFFRRLPRSAPPRSTRAAIEDAEKLDGNGVSISELPDWRGHSVRHELP